MPLHHFEPLFPVEFPTISGSKSVEGQSFFDKDFSGFTSSMFPQPDSDFNPYSGSHIAVIIDGNVVIL